MLFDVIAFDRWMSLTGTSNQLAADQIGVSKSTVSQWRNGVTLPRVTLLPIVEAFIRERNLDLQDALTIEVVHRNIRIC